MTDLRTAAQALVDRWDTPNWKDAPHTGKYIDALRAALSAPAGWKLVPIEPTLEMVGAMAVIEPSMTINGKPVLGMAGSVDAWEAAIAAAPSPQEQTNG